MAKATIASLEARVDELQAELAAANARLDAAAKWASQVERRLTSTGCSVKMERNTRHSNTAREVY